MLNVILRPVDKQRASRLLLAMLSDDKVTLDVALGEAAEDPDGVAGVLFAVLSLAAKLAELVGGETAADSVLAGLAELLDRDQGGAS